MPLDRLIVIYYNSKINMNNLKFGFISLALTAAFIATTSPVSASEISFTSCLTPAGSVSADYATGAHGIVGNGSVEGHDTVYALQSGDSMQCLCASNGAGTQTNWMKISDLTEDQIKIYENQGWIYVPDGSSWGLSESAYLAQNLSYSCGGSTTTNSGGGDTHGDGLSDGRTDGRSDGRGSIVQSAVGSASGLASTGNITLVLSMLGAGIFMTLAGLYMRKNTK